MKLSITHIDYKNSNYSTPTLRIFGRDENGKRAIKYASGKFPYFYAKADEIFGITDNRILRYENAPPTLYGDKVVRVVCTNPNEVAGNQENHFYVRDNFKWLGESDVLFASRAKIDHKLSGIIETPEKDFITLKDIKPSSAKIKLRSHFLDIEAVGGSIQDIIKGRSLIPCLTVYDTYLNTYFLFTTIPLSQRDIETIKQKLHDFWTTSLEKLKASIPLEQEEEKRKKLEKQVKYLEKNLTRILAFKISVKSAPSESQMFIDYLSFVTQNRPDVRCGWNSVKFDDPAIINRMKTLNLPFQQLSDVGEAFISKRDDCNISGVVLMDLMDRYVKLQPATPSHRSLDFISKKELGVGKLIAGGHELYSSDPVTYLAYNIVDVMLTVELDNLLHIIDFYVEIANLTNSNLNETSRSTYIDNLILTYCNNLYVLPTRSKIEGKKMSGAVVYSPTPGLHKNVILLDFKGMYPSIMSSLNISPETKSLTGDIIAANGIRFDSTKIGIIPFILQDLDSRRNELKKLKKEAEDANDLETAHEYDLKQSAVKIISNAFYGVQGYSKFRLADSEVGDSVTSTGRMLSTSTKAFVEGLGHKVKVVYGDSVTKNTSIWIKNKSGEIYQENIENLFKTIDYRDGDKEYDFLEDLKTLTINDIDGKSVWKSIKYVMRHKTNKQIKKVTAGKFSSICVTEDHSLMGYVSTRRLLKYNKSRIAEVKPDDIGKRCNSLITIKYIPRDIIETKNYPKELYQLLGFFVGDGSYRYTCPNKNGIKTFNSIGLSCGIDTKNIIDKLLIPLKNMGYVNHFWENEKNSNNGNLQVNGKIVRLLDDFKNSQNKKIIPEWVLKETQQNLSYFLGGIFESDGCISRQSKNDKNSAIAFSNTNTEILESIQKCLWFIGVPSSIYLHNGGSQNGMISLINGRQVLSKLQLYDLFIKSTFLFKKRIEFITDRKQTRLTEHNLSLKGKKNVTNMEYDYSNKIKVENIDYDDYVYDIEVEDTHTFFANGFLAHNTDSLFIEVLENNMTYDQINALSKILVDKINEFLPKLLKEKFNTDTCYCKIEADAPYHKLVMLPKKTIGKDEEETQAKKRYAAYKWTGENKFEFKAKGLEYVKGNTADITRYTQEKLLKYILDSTDLSIITKFLKSLHTDFFNEAFPIEKIGKPSSIRKPLSEYASDIPIKRAALFSNRYLNTEFEEGSSFILFYLQNARTDVIALNYGEVLPPEYHIDMNMTWEKLVVSPTETILQTRNLKWDDIINGIRNIEMTSDVLSESKGLPPIIIESHSPKQSPKPLTPIEEYDLFA
jgi:DNA polymerase elongation subunit (family B)